MRKEAFEIKIQGIEERIARGEASNATKFKVYKVNINSFLWIR